MKETKNKNKTEQNEKRRGIPYQRLALPLRTQVNHLHLGLARRGGPSAYFPRHEAAIAACLISGNFIKLSARLTGQEDARLSESGV